jgi:hypothetical protein
MNCQEVSPINETKKDHLYMAAGIWHLPPLAVAAEWRGDVSQLAMVT